MLEASLGDGACVIAARQILNRIGAATCGGGSRNLMRALIRDGDLGVRENRTGGVRHSTRDSADVCVLRLDAKARCEKQNECNEPGEFTAWIATHGNASERRPLGSSLFLEKGNGSDFEVKLSSARPTVKSECRKRSN
jgi:hypothetical protein